MCMHILHLQANALFNIDFCYYYYLLKKQLLLYYYSMTKNKHMTKTREKWSDKNKKDESTPQETGQQTLNKRQKTLEKWI